MTLFQYFDPNNFAWFHRDGFVDSLRGFNSILMANKFCWVPCTCLSGHFSALDFVASANGNLQTFRNCPPPPSGFMLLVSTKGFPRPLRNSFLLKHFIFREMCVLSFLFLFLAAGDCGVWPHLKARAPQKNNFLHDGLDFTAQHHLTLFFCQQKEERTLCSVVVWGHSRECVLVFVNKCRIYPIQWFCVPFAPYVPFYTNYIDLILFMYFIITSFFFTYIYIYLR